METVTSVLFFIGKRDIIFSEDLKDVYSLIPIHSHSRLYLCFVLQGTIYQFKAFYFVLSTAPQAFTSFRFGLTHSPTWHTPSLSCGWLARHIDSLPHMLECCHLLLQLCKDLGIVIYWEKLDLEPKAQTQYLGMLVTI